MPRILFLLNFCLLLQFSPAQSPLLDLEKELALKLEAMSASRDDAERLALADEFKVKLKANLYKPGVFDHPFESLKMCSLTSPDKAFRVFNWNIPLNDGTHRYEAFIVIPQQDKGADMVEVIELKAISKDTDRLESRNFREREWLPFLIYEIIPEKKSGQYVLLAWDGHDRISNRKIIDVLNINGRSVRMGAPIFKNEQGTAKRVIFTYAEEVNMSLRYQAKEKRILFDHLAPRDARLEDQYQFYGPDMSFDAYVSDKGKWVLESDVEFLRKRQEKDKDFRDPRRK